MVCKGNILHIRRHYQKTEEKNERENDGMKTQFCYQNCKPSEKYF